MTFRRWTIEKKPRGFLITYRIPGGIKVQSYPVIGERFNPAFIFYPYALKKAIQAVRETAEAFEPHVCEARGA